MRKCAHVNKAKSTKGTSSAEIPKLNLRRLYDLSGYKLSVSEQLTLILIISPNDPGNDSCEPHAFRDRIDRSGLIYGK